MAAHGHQFKQAYVESCEIALIRLSLGLMGVKATEDEILATIPRMGTDPEKALVCDDLNGGRLNPDGSIHWNNYGTHPPVVVGELTRRLAAAGLAGRYRVAELKATDADLRRLIATNPQFLGAIVWVVGHPSRYVHRAAVNDRGMVLGEHVRFVEPLLGPGGLFRVYDPETGQVSTATDAGAERDLFQDRVVGIYAL